MWPFTSWSTSKAKLSEKEQSKIRKKCKTFLSAYAACRKIYPNSPSSCERLETRVLECYAAQCPGCAPQLEAFQKCLLGTGVIVGGVVGNECSQQVGDMRKCLAKLHMYPIS